MRNSKLKILAFISLLCILLWLPDASKAQGIKHTAIKQLDTPPTIDGDATDWSGDYQVLDSLNSDNEPDSVDIYASFQAGWDADNLYLFIKVTDDNLNVQDSLGIWNRDGVEIALNLDGNTTFGAANWVNWTGDDNDGKIIVAYKDNTDSLANGRLSDKIVGVEGYEVASKDIEGGYTLEIQIPWTSIWADADMTVGHFIGMEIFANDNDTGTNNRDNIISWAGSENINFDGNDFGYGLLTTTALNNMKVDLGTATIDASGDEYKLDAEKIRNIVKFSKFDDTDLSAQMQAMWDDTNLYLYFDVKDDSINVQDSLKVWNRDGLEIAISLIEGSGFRAASWVNWCGGNDDAKILVNPISNAVDYSDLISTQEGYEVASVETDHGYKLEVQIPWASIYEDFVPVNGQQFNLEVFVNDNDDATNAGRQSVLGWSTATNINFCGEGFGTAKLTGAPVSEMDIMAGTPTIDGNGDEYTSDPQVVKNMVNGIVSDSTDLYAAINAKWDNEYLYLFADVTDDNVHNNGALKLWNRDGLEIAISLIEGSGFGAFNWVSWCGGNDDGKLTLIAGDSNDSIPNGRLSDKISAADGYQVASNVKDGGYTIEARIPWKSIYADFEAINGLPFNIEIFVNDNDEGTDSREGIKGWSVAENSNFCGDGFGKATLKGGTPTEMIIENGTANIDGQGSEYTTQAQPVKNIVRGNNPETADLAPEVTAIWDTDNLYLYVSVKDDSINNQDSIALWNRDGIEIALSLIEGSNFSAASWASWCGGDDDGKITLVAGDNTDSIANDRLTDKIASADGYQVASVINDDGYTIEAKIPWASIYADFVATSDAAFNMEIFVNDNDNAKNERENILGWSVATNSNFCGEGFGKVTLSGTSQIPDQFSEDEKYGNIKNYTALNADLWEVAVMGGNALLTINSSSISPIHPSGDPWYNPDPTQYSNGQESTLGAMAIVADESYEDFQMKMKVAKPDFENENGNYDIAVVFGYTDANNYSYININNNADEMVNTIVNVVDGKGLRAQYKDSWSVEAGQLLVDNELHELVVTRIGNQVKLSYDGQEVLNVTNEVFGAAGAVGVGSWNDAGYFDNITAQALLTVFSDDEIFGNAMNYTNPVNPEKWEVAEVAGDLRYIINTSAVDPVHPSGDPWYNPDPTQYSNGQESALGEIAVVESKTYSDFELTVDVAKPEFENENGYYDLAIVFGYTDANNYSYINLNGKEDEVAHTLAAVVDGKGLRNQHADSWSADGVLVLTDNDFHTVTIRREGNTVKCLWEGTEILNITDEALGLEGAIGLGSYNDAAYFDNLSVQGVSLSGLNNIETVAEGYGKVEGAMLKEVPEATTANDLLTALTLSEKATGKIIDADGNDVDGATEVTSGMKVQVTAENGNQKEYEIEVGKVLDNNNDIVDVFAPASYDETTGEINVLKGVDAATIVEKVKCAETATELVVDADGNEVAPETLIIDGMKYRIVAENGDIANYPIILKDPEYPLVDIYEAEENTIIIDAWFDDWAEITPQLDINKQPDDAEINPTAEDCSAYYKMAWDATYLYLYFNITDDVFVTTETNPWENDGIEIALVMTDDLTQRADYNMFWEPEKQPGNMKLMYVKGFDIGSTTTHGINTGSEMRDWSGAIIEAYDKDDGTGYEVEMQLPWTSLNGKSNDNPVVPENNEKFSIQIAVNDNDGSGRDVILLWADKAFNTNQDASNYGLITMLNDPGSGIKELSQLAIKVYPNPVADNLFIQSKENLQRIALYNVTGTLIREVENTAYRTTTLSTRNLESGIYMIRITTTDGQVATGKFIKE